MTPFDPKLAAIAADARVKTPHVFHCWHAMRKMGLSFRRDVFANFAGLEVRHVDAIIAAMEAHKCLPRLIEDKPKQTHGSRLPADWMPPEEYLSWAMTERYWTREIALQVAAEFKDYWLGATGARAVKADWLATWRNNVRRSTRPNGTLATKSVAEDPRALLVQQEALYRRIGRVTEAEDIQRKIDAMGANVVPLRA